MTANQLLLNIRNVIGMITSGDIPVKINGKEVMICDVTLEGSNGDYWCDIKTKQSKGFDTSLDSTRFITVVQRPQKTTEPTEQ